MRLRSALRLASDLFWDRLALCREFGRAFWDAAAKPGRRGLKPRPLAVEALEVRLVPSAGRPEPLPIVVTGSDAGSQPLVKIYDGTTGALELQFMAFDRSFLGGVRVASADLDADGFPDVIAAAGPGGHAQVRVFDGKTGRLIGGPLGSFTAFPGFNGGVNVAAGDVNGDGWADLVVAADAGGGPHVKAFSGTDGSLLASFYAYAPTFTGGVRVAAADLDGDGRDEVITGAGPGGGPHVHAYSIAGGQATVLPGALGSFYAFGAHYTGGVYVAAGDVNADGTPDLIVGAGSGHSPEVKVYSGAGGSVLSDFQAFGPSVRGGVRVASSWVDDDPNADVVAGTGSGSSARVRVFSGATMQPLAAPLGDFAPYGTHRPGGVFVAAANDPLLPSSTFIFPTSSTVYGQTFSLTAYVTGSSYPYPVPTGTVTLEDGGTVIATTSLVSNAAFFTSLGAGMAAGTHALTAVYSGDSVYAGSTSPASNHTVDKASTTTTLAGPGFTPVFDETFAVTATVAAVSPGAGNPTGTVTVTDGGNFVGSGTVGAGGVATIDLNLVAGSHSLTATYAGDSDFYGSSGYLTQTVNTLTVDFPPDDAPPPCPAACQTGGDEVEEDPDEGTEPDDLSSRPVRYSDGVVALAGLDLESDGFGTPWGQGRSWTNGPGYADGGVNGSGWVDTQMPHLIEGNGDYSVAEVGNGTTARFYDLVAGSYAARFYDATAFTHDTADDEFDLADGSGDVLRFYDFSSSVPSGERGQFKSDTDPDGHVTAVTSHDSAGRITEVQRSDTTGGTTVTESYLYTYVSSGVNAGLLSDVTLRRQTNGGSWSTVQSVDYVYYNGTESYGNAGDLKTATVNDASGNPIDTNYYRYYVSGEANGYQHGLKYAFGPEAYGRLTGALGTSLSSLTDSQVAPYADNYFQYDSSHRVTEEIASGAGCSACSGGQGTYTYAYTASSNAQGTNSWATKAVETLPDGNQNTVYTNAYGEVMLKAYEDTTTSQVWPTFYEYDARGREILEADPSAVTGYNDTYADLLHATSGNYQYISDSSGLGAGVDYYGSSTATATTAGGVSGFLEDVQLRQGETGTAVPQETWQYFSVAAGGATVHPLATDTVYRNADGTGAETTSYAYTWFSGSVAEQSAAVTAPTVGSGENGPGTADVTTAYMDAYGRVTWTKDADGYLTYTAYDVATGAATKTIDDVNTADSSDFSGLPSSWSTPTGGGLELIATMTVDALGRTTELTDPDGNVTYTVYDDPDHEVRTYAGWNSSTDTPTGPTVVEREDFANNYVETLTMTASPHLTGGVPDGTEAVSGLQSLSRDYANAAGQYVTEDDYFNLSGVTYSTSAGIGTSGTNYYETQDEIDGHNEVKRELSPTGTITRYVYDGQKRLVSEWVGTNDTPASGYWSPTNNGGSSNMQEVSAFEYDGGGVGDGDLTKETDYPGGSAAARVTETWYDWRDRPVAVKGGVQTTEGSTTHRPIVYTTYDNLGEATEIQQFDGDGVSITTTGGVPVAPSSSLLRAETVTSYDEQGRAYRTQTYDVNPTTGSVSTNALTTNVWYDHRDDVIKSAEPGGLVTKDAYDGAARLTAEYTTDGGGDSSWSDAGNVTGDAVLEQDEYAYDADGNVIETTSRQRDHDETATGALGNATTSPKARVSYTATYYDALDRPTATVDVGTNGGSSWTRPSSVPSRSDTVLVGSETYNAAGYEDTSTDPSAIVNKTYYDALGRTTETIEDYVDGTPSTNDDKTTLYTYDGDDDLLTLTADQAGGGSQTTQYVYGVSPSDGSTVTSNDVLRAVEYPDPSTGAASSSSEDTYTSDALGETLTSTDRNGSVHTYGYDILDRLTSDAVTTLGSGVDGSVRRIEYAYDTQGNMYLTTSYNAASGGSVVNQVQMAYNGLGQETADYQAHSGSVNTSTTPVVQYAYTEMSGGANNSRPTTMTYPNGNVLTYNYSSGLNDSISRLSSISDSTGTLEAYSYLGLDTVVVRSYPQPGTELSYVKQSGESNGDAGDQYTGLDRFGRVVDQRWVVTSTGAATDRFQYGYDRDSNVLWMNNLVNSAFGELYTYDGLNQLTSYERGALNSTKTGLTGSASRSQSWSTDALGNFTSVTSDGTSQSRATNAQNELTGMGSATLAYDADGNVTTDDYGHTLVYDAWNRLVEVKNGSTVLETESYDGLDRLVSQAQSGTTTDLYYSSAWQVIEERVGGQATAQYVWSPVGTDTLVLRDRDTDGNGTLDERLWVQQDARGSVTALLNNSGTVVERYAYDPYGAATVYDASYTVQSGGSNYNWVYQHQGLRYDQVAGLYQDRMRWYSPTEMRFVSYDPVGFRAGDTNLYRSVSNNPIDFTDPSGEFIPLIIAGIIILGGGAGAYVGYTSGNGSGTLEGFVPGWGAGRDAGACFSKGSDWRGVGHGALAVSDALLIGSLAKGVGKVGAKGLWSPGTLEVYRESELFLQNGKEVPHYFWTLGDRGRYKYYHARGNLGKELLTVDGAVFPGYNQGFGAIDDLSRFDRVFRFRVFSTSLAGDARLGSSALTCWSAPFAAWSSGTFHAVPYIGLHGLQAGSDITFPLPDGVRPVIVDPKIPEGLIPEIDPKTNEGGGDGPVGPPAPRR